MDYFSTILSQIGWPSLDDGPVVELVGFTGCMAGQGVSTVASHVARQASQCQANVLLVDCNLQNPSIHHMHRVAASPGLIDVVTSRAEIDSVVHTSGHGDVQVLSAGDVARNVDLQLDCIGELFKSLVSDFDLVICDVAPVSGAADTASLLRIMDRVVMVIASGQTHRAVAAEASETLQRAGVQLSGVVVNRTRHRSW